MAEKTRKHRSAEERIADLQAKIEAIQSRAERKQAKSNPAVRHTIAAVKALDKALSETADAVTRKAIEEARVTLAACLATHGVQMAQVGAKAGSRPRRRIAQVG